MIPFIPHNARSLNIGILSTLRLFAPQSHTCTARSGNQPSLFVKHIAHDQANGFTPADDAAFGSKLSPPDGLEEIDL